MCGSPHSGAKVENGERPPCLRSLILEAGGLPDLMLDKKRIPGWVFNVRAHSSGTIEIDGEVSEAQFVELEGEVAARIYKKLGDAWSSVSNVRTQYRARYPRVQD